MPFYSNNDILLLRFISFHLFSFIFKIISKNRVLIKEFEELWVLSFAFGFIFCFEAVGSGE